MSEPPLEQQEERPAPKAGQRFPCRACGADLVYEPGTELLRCPHCGADDPIEAAAEPVEELDYHAHLARLEASEETREQVLLRCTACAAQIEPPPNVTALACPYCGASMIAADRASHLRPRSLLPFAMDATASRDAWRRWLKGLWFAPNALRRHAREDGELLGLYVPCWTFDCDAHSAYTGERGDDYWVTVGSGKSRRRVRRTRWRHAAGRVFNRFDDVLVIASHSFDPKLAAKLEPWDLGALVPFSEGYLAGFAAERYQIDLAPAFEQARGHMETMIRITVQGDIGGDRQRIHTLHTRWEAITFKHLLLPVWISAYRYRGRVYRFLVNGRTGEVQGERPWSWVKIAALVLVMALVVLVVVLVKRQAG